MGKILFLNFIIIFNFGLQINVRLKQFYFFFKSIINKFSIFKFLVQDSRICEKCSNQNCERKVQR